MVLGGGWCFVALGETVIRYRQCLLIALGRVRIIKSTQEEELDAFTSTGAQQKVAWWSTERRRREADKEILSGYFHQMSPQPLPVSTR